MNDITQQQLRTVLATPDADKRAAQWLSALQHCMQGCAIDTPLRQAAFLAQILVESSALGRLEESLNYSAPRLRQVWPQRFPTDEIAARYAHNAAALANYVYAGRMGNGDEHSGDGWRYRGRGLIQLTGRANYALFSKDMQVDALGDPDQLLQPAGAALSAGWFWRAKGLNELADQTGGADAANAFVQITKRINGGTIGLDERKAYWSRARQALGLPAV
ncbi:glycoside hydrolase family 19 protein [Massilia endophytica]|uniref:glycoside hydrolase family 19 protein n=1 Tax=Massilia endophytica TaxID=2899220 RepID=UPI001E5D3968|nr:glycoside hydrolase family 19 protein [Massilia endophytica]UGQ48934.1 glycoside hydrolase family 19 protein [Massilia endophytica]